MQHESVTTEIQAQHFGYNSKHKQRNGHPTAHAKTFRAK